MWQPDVPRATRLFLWRALNDILPTRLNLWKRKVIDGSSCPICNKGDESVLHVLWSCPASSDLWTDHDCPLQKWKVAGWELLQLWSEICKDLPVALVEKLGNYEMYIV